MHKASIRICFLGLLIVPVFCVAQESAVRVGVAVMQNHAGRSVPGTLERDRLVKVLNQQKPDKKTHMKIEAIPLDGSNANEAGDEATAKKCAYVVYTTLTELRTGGDPYQHVPGTVETNPNGQWNSRNAETQAVDPEYRATVEYKLVKVGNPGVISGAPFSTQQSGNEFDTVSQIMDRIATRVADEIKKGGPPPLSE